MTSETYEFNRFRRISPSGDMDFVFHEGDRLTNVSIAPNRRGRLTVRLHVKRVKRLSREDQADLAAELDEEEK